MKAKLIKLALHDGYRLDDENGLYIASTLESSKSKLSLSNCQAIERGYDLDELAEEWVFETNGHKWSNNDDTAGDNYGSFKAGFQKALELMGDKKFTEQDIHEAYFLGERDDRGGLHDILKSQSQHEWDVEIETIEYGLGNDKDGRPVYENRCLLDSDGCLILKLKSE